MGNVILIYFQIKGSETSSELDLTPKSEISKPLMSSTLSESTESVPIAVEQVK